MVAWAFSLGLLYKTQLKRFTSFATDSFFLTVVTHEAQMGNRWTDETRPGYGLRASNECRTYFQVKSFDQYHIEQVFCCIRRSYVPDGEQVNMTSLCLDACRKMCSQHGAEGSGFFFAVLKTRRHQAGDFWNCTSFLVVITIYFMFLWNFQVGLFVFTFLTTPPNLNSISFLHVCTKYGWPKCFL